MITQGKLTIEILESEYSRKSSSALTSISEIERSSTKTANICLSDSNEESLREFISKTLELIEQVYSKQ